MPRLGQGTWKLGEFADRRSEEVAALQLGFDLGLTLVDTAEMYAMGGAEEVVGEAIRGRRDGLYLVSKVLPQNASRAGTLRAAEASLRRLGTDRLDLYLLHWAGAHPLEETLAAFEQLRAAGKLLACGVSNFDLDELAAAVAVAGAGVLAANQVLYNLTRRGIERRLLPWCRERDIVVMAYSPLEQGRLGGGRVLERVAQRRGLSPAQVALAWTLRDHGLVSIPKSSSPEHLRANAACLELELDPQDLAELDAAYPVPESDALEYL